MSNVETIDWGVVFETLANEERREILHYLTSEQETLSVRDLAERLSVDPDDDGAVHRARVQLHHVHLPKLNDAGLVVWGRDQGTLRETERAHQLPAGAIPTGPMTAEVCQDERQTSD
ncbi:winged helix-turn-helix domain-containing protein [Haloarcula salina]|uniref:Winged helix-turn-helix domain-containing protein n=1 Tax=Haloarcula salina TaxID=1429914 RepID=A0AA41G4N6_9EURY|nr:winged helix-turn-helix domain-containing protein [Haloarcula salina]MBV0903434.1 winged helix-turn-helix domain-containing protein [Haloarcula salina]